MTVSKKLVFDNSERAYLLCVLQDEEFLNRAEHIKDRYGAQKVTETDPELIDLAWDYDVSVSDCIELVYGKEPDATKGINGVGVLAKTIEDGGPSIVIYVGEGASKRDVMLAVEGIETAIEKVYGTIKKKNKGPENFQLVYAIHRARRKGLKFSEIYRLYLDNKLNHYRGSSSINTLSKFTEYYRRYEPRFSIPPLPINSDGHWMLDADDNSLGERTVRVKKSGLNPQ